MSVDPIGDLVDVYVEAFTRIDTESIGPKIRAGVTAVQQAVNHQWLDILPAGTLVCGCGDFVDTPYQCDNCDTANWAAAGVDADIVQLLRQAMGGLRSHAIIPDTANEPEWYRGQADVIQQAAAEIEALREAVRKLAGPHAHFWLALPPDRNGHSA